MTEADLPATGIFYQAGWWRLLIWALTSTMSFCCLTWRQQNHQRQQEEVDILYSYEPIQWTQRVAGVCARWSFTNHVIPLPVVFLQTLQTSYTDKRSGLNVHALYHHTLHSASHSHTFSDAMKGVFLTEPATLWLVNDLLHDRRIVTDLS